MTQKNDQHRELRNLFINPSFQLKFLSYFIGLFILTTVSLYSTTYLFFWTFKEKAIKIGIPEGHVFYKFLEHQKNDLDMLFVGLAIFNLLLLITVGFIISHRIAGPLHKVKNSLSDISSESEPIKLRQKDFFREFEPLVNKLKEKLK